MSYEIHVSKRRQRFVKVFSFGDKATAMFWLGALRVNKNVRKRLVEVSL